MTDPALEASGVTITRGGQPVLDGVDLSVGRGDRVVIRGASGSGKSTLFAVLGLLEPADDGVVSVDEARRPASANASERRSDATTSGSSFRTSS